MTHVLASQAAPAAAGALLSGSVGLFIVAIVAFMMGKKRGSIPLIVFAIVLALAALSGISSAIVPDLFKIAIIIGNAILAALASLLHGLSTL